MEWINVDTVRPEIAEWVLCICSKNSYWIAFRANGGWYVDTNYGQKYIANNDTYKQIDITHWMPLPKLPKR